MAVLIAPSIGEIYSRLPPSIARVHTARLDRFAMMALEDRYSEPIVPHHGSIFFVAVKTFSPSEGTDEAEHTQPFANRKMSTNELQLGRGEGDFQFHCRNGKRPHAISLWPLTIHTC